MPETRPQHSAFAELGARVERAEALAKVASPIRYDQPLPDVLTTLASHVVERSKAVASGVLLMSLTDMSLIAQGTCNLPAGFMEGMVDAARAMADRDEWRRAVEKGRSWVGRAREFIASRPDYAHMLDLIRDAPWDTFIATPSMPRPDIYIVVYLYYARDIDVDEEEVNFARAIAGQVAPVADNAWLFSEAQRRTSELEALHRADAALNESLRLRDVLQAMADLAVDLLGADRSIFATWNDAGDMVIQAARGFDAAAVTLIEARYHEMGLGRATVVANPGVALIEDVANDPRADPELGRISGAASVASLPVWVAGEIYGFFQIGFLEPHRFTDRDGHLFETLAARAGLAIQNALLFEASIAQTQELAAKVGQLEALHRADAAMHESLDLEDVFEAMIDLAIDLLGADQSVLITWGADDHLAVRAARGLSDDEITRLGAAYRVYERSRFRGWIPEIAFVEDVSTEARLDPRARENSPSGSIVELPVVVRGELFGFFTIGFTARRTFDEASRRMFDTLANRAGLAIQNALLYQESGRQTEDLRERMRQLEALQRADEALHRSLRLHDVYRAMVDLAIDLVGADRSILIAWDEHDRLHAHAARGIHETELAALNEVYHSVPRERFGGRIPEMTLIGDIRTDARMDPGVRQITSARSVVDIPIVVGGEFFGLFVVSYLEQRTFTDGDRRLFDTLSSRTSLAIQNALLYEQSAAQTVELEGRVRQLEALRTIASSLTLEQDVLTICSGLATRVVEATAAQACTITVLDTDARHPFRMLGTAGFPDGFAAAMQRGYAAGAPSITAAILAERALRVIPGGRGTALSDERYAEARALVADAQWDTLVSLPIVFRDEPTGVLVACYAADWERDEDEIRFLAAIADQGAVAIENQRLLGEASTIAALEERQRLARELHDSVSQALYGIALGARTARRRLGEDGDPTVIEAVEYVLALAEAGLTETRALIFELIPESLANEGLAVAIKRQADATHARHQIAVHLDIAHEPDVPIKTKEALYRIAQESLNNIAKHAQAQNAHITLHSGGPAVILEVRDDGRGFDPAGEFPGHLGLISMGERAARIGGTYAIESAPGAGTRILVTVPLEPASA